MSTQTLHNLTTKQAPPQPTKATESPFAPKEPEEQEQATSMAIFFILLVVGKHSVASSNWTKVDLAETV